MPWTALVLAANLLTGCVGPLSVWFGSDETEEDDSAWEEWAYYDTDEQGDSLHDGEARYSLSLTGIIGRPSGFSDIGAITYVSGDTYWVASDSGGLVGELTIDVDATTGRIGGCRLVRTMKLENRVDIEGLAYDPLAGILWSADEAGCVITGHSVQDGRQLVNVPVPSCYGRCRANLSLESLSVREDGLEMWTCNECPLEGDGELSTKTAKSFVRLSRFIRADGDLPWQPAGQWAYPVGRMHGDSFRGIAVRGVTDLCVLPDGTLLSLEREFSKSWLPSFRCRIYQISFAGATDVTSVEKLTDEDIVPVARRRLWAADTAFTNYEGMCLGRSLSDGSRVLLLVSDGDGRASERFCSFKLGVADD